MNEWLLQHGDQLIKAFLCTNVALLLIVAFTSRSHDDDRED